MTAADANAAALAVIVLVIIGGAAALAWAFIGSHRITAATGRCDWCDGFTTDRRTCICTEACTFVPQCGARKGPLQ